MSPEDEDWKKDLEDKLRRLEILVQEGKQEKQLPRGDDLDPVEIPMAKTRVLMHEIILASQTDELGICFGGQVLSWIDICAGLAAKNAARGACVTASLDTVHFLRPCRSGCIAIVCAMVNRTFTTSMEVGVRVEVEDPKSGVREHCCSAYLTFVALKARKDPMNTKLLSVIPSSKEEIQTHREAGERRQERLDKRVRLKSNDELAAREALARLQPIHEEGGPTLPPAIRADSVCRGHVLEVLPSVTTAHMTQLIMPQHANSLGITFGGQVLSWMEKCAAISASRLRGGHMLTASIDTMTFTRSTRVGDVIYVSSQVTAVFESSMEVMVTVYGEDISEKQAFHCADAFVTVACVDGHGKPMPIHIKLAPQTDAEKIRHEGASSRRESRLESRRALLCNLGRKISLDGHRWGEG